MLFTGLLPLCGAFLSFELNMALAPQMNWFVSQGGTLTWAWLTFAGDWWDYPT
jgi:hypothetical protein